MKAQNKNYPPKAVSAQSAKAQIEKNIIFRKLSIHNIEDDSQDSRKVKLSLCFDNENKIDDDTLRLKFVENNYIFKRFVFVGEAINYYETTKDYPDIIVIDIDFTKLDAIPNIDAIEISNTRGIDMIKYVLQYLPEQTLMVILTGQAQNVFREVQPFMNNRNFIMKDVGKSNFENIESVLIQYLKETAKNYFKTIPLTQRGDLKRLLTSRSTSIQDILQHNIVFDNFVFQLEYLLIGYCTISYNKSSGIINKEYSDLYEDINKLIRITNRNFEFTGDWRTNNNGVPKMVEIHINNPIPEFIHLVNKHSFSLLLEILAMVRGLTTEEIKVRDYLKIRPTCGISNTTVEENAIELFMLKILTKKSLSRNEPVRVFIDKLVARRILLIIQNFISDDKDEFCSVCDILIDNAINDKTTETEREKRGKKDNNTLAKWEHTRLNNLCNTKLGLTKIGTVNFETREEYVLPDEEEWMDTYTVLVEKSIEFIAIIQDSFIKYKREKTLPINKPNFIIFDDINTYLNIVKKIDSTVYKELADLMYEWLEDDYLEIKENAEKLGFVLP